MITMMTMSRKERYKIKITIIEWSQTTIKYASSTYATKTTNVKSKKVLP